MAGCGTFWAEPPVMAPEVGLILGPAHVYVVPDGTFAGAKLKATPLQVLTFCWVVMAGTGFTVTPTLNGTPAQLEAPEPDIGVTV